MRRGNPPGGEEILEGSQKSPRDRDFLTGVEISSGGRFFLRGVDFSSGRRDFLRGVGISSGRQDFLTRVDFLSRGRDFLDAWGLRLRHLGFYSPCRAKKKGKKPPLPRKLYFRDTQQYSAQHIHTRMPHHCRPPASTAPPHPALIGYTTPRPCLAPSSDASCMRIATAPSLRC